MIGILLQIIFTILVWNRGWRWLSLIPIGAGFIMGMLIGLIGGSMGYTAEDMNWASFLDVLIYIALIVMLCVKPKSTNNSTDENKKIVL